MFFDFNQQFFSTCKLFIAAALFTSITACSSPTEKAEGFYQNGVKQLEKGELAKSRIEFQNAVQLKPKMVQAWYGLAKIAEAEGDFSKLFGLLEKVVELDSKHVEAKIKLGRLYLVAGKVDKALEMGNAALLLAPQDPAAKSLKAATLFKLNDTKSAVDLANAILLDHPHYIDALVILATERIAAGDSEKAIEYLDQGLELNEKNIALQLIKIQALNNLKKNDNAIAVYKKLIDLYPKSNELKVGLAELYYRLGKMNEAELELRTVIKLNPSNTSFKTNLVSFIYSVKGADLAKKELENLVANDAKDFDLKFALVNFYQDHNDKKLAETMLNDIVKQEADSINGIKAKGLLATTALAEGNKERSSALVEEILKKDKNNEQALMLKSSMLLDANLIDDAITSLRIILRDSPNSSRALLLLARAYEQAGSVALADENYYKSFQASKFSSQSGIPYAQFLVKQKQVPRAEKILEDILSVRPDELKTLQLLAQLKLSQGDLAGAQKIADDIRKNGVGNNVSEQIMGVVFAAKKNYAESISSFQRAYNASPNDMQPIASLVKAYLLAGKAKEASVFLDNVLKANPNNTNAKLLQNQLLIMSGHQEKAIENFNQLIVDEPNNLDVYQQLAITHIRDNQLIEAEKVIKLGLSKVPNNFGLMLSQAGLYELTKRYDDAMHTYELILKAQPNAEIPANNYASLLAERKSDKQSLEKAYAIAQRFRNSDIPQFKDTFGWAAYRLAKYDEALGLIKSASEQMPDDAIFHYHLGKIYLAKLDKSNAKKEFEHVLKLSKNDNFEFGEEVRSLLKEI
jgi:tetratricopeptide (TPR) repeat protein